MEKVALTLLASLRPAASMNCSSQPRTRVAPPSGLPSTKTNTSSLKETCALAALSNRRENFRYSETTDPLTTADDIKSKSLSCRQTKSARKIRDPPRDFPQNRE